jgi:hypothetical protein
MKQSSFLLFTILLLVLAVSQIGRRDGGPDRQIRRSSGNVEDCLRLLCRGRENLGFLVSNVGQFIILGTGHVLAQTDPEKTEDLKQTAKPEEDFEHLLMVIRRIFISEASVGGFFGALLVWLSSRFVPIPFILTAESWPGAAGIIIGFHSGGIIGGALSNSVIKLLYPNKIYPALIVGLIAGAGWPFVALLAVELAKGMATRAQAAIMAGGLAFFAGPTTDAPKPDNAVINNPDEKPDTKG